MPSSYSLPTTHYQLSLIIPAYNEAKRLPAFLASITEYDRTHPNDIHEIIVVDDGSTDNTTAIARSFAEKLNKLQTIAATAASRRDGANYHLNKGKGYAVKTGVEAATGDLIVFMDADGATPITELPKMIAALQEADVAVGNRWMAGAIVDRSSFIRHFAGWVYKTYMSLFGLGSIDTMCGFKGYRANIARDLFKDLIENRWLFDTEIAYKAVRHGYTIKNFPIEWEAKAGSKLTLVDQLKIAFQIWPLIQKIKKQENHAQ